MNPHQVRVILFGCSAGSLHALRSLFSRLPRRYPLPIVGVTHTREQGEWLLPELLGRRCLLNVRSAVDKETIQPGSLYLAPPGYHLLLERDETLSLSMDERVHGSRPAIDPLFESAADSLGDKVLAIILTGGGCDGAQGLRAVADAGGVCLIQDPASAEASSMPLMAMAAVLEKQRRVLSLEQIGTELLNLGEGKNG
ncbi:MAG: chemotaxis protein CheB [Magnetococcales bacterium]|nr:chemotaxis protein CheB [Magnetococcales bacterium]MBF0583389.1 chemotaxis protein CheB [Magnetococcales bacterium]